MRTALYGRGMVSFQGHFLLTKFQNHHHCLLRDVKLKYSHQNHKRVLAQQDYPYPKTSPVHNGSLVHPSLFLQPALGFLGVP